jgi:hypothetical protein
MGKSVCCIMESMLYYKSGWLKIATAGKLLVGTYYSEFQESLWKFMGYMERCIVLCSLGFIMTYVWKVWFPDNLWCKSRLSNFVVKHFMEYMEKFFMV